MWLPNQNHGKWLVWMFLSWPFLNKRSRQDFFSCFVWRWGWWQFRWFGKVKSMKLGLTLVTEWYRPSLKVGYSIDLDQSGVWWTLNPLYVRDPSSRSSKPSVLDFVWLLAKLIGNMEQLKVESRWSRRQWNVFGMNNRPWVRRFAHC